MGSLMYHGTKEELYQEIEKFLAEYRESSGGFAEVTPDDIRQLDKIIYLLIRLKTDLDPDGDETIEYFIINRTVEYFPRFEPVMYSNPDYSNLGEIMLRQHYNALIANHEFEISMNIFRSKLLEKRDKK